MALTELTALDNAYRALQPLGRAARRRALQWLSDALIPKGVNGYSLPETPAAAETTALTVEPAIVEPVEPVAVEPVTVAAAPARRRKAAAAAHAASAMAVSSKTARGRRVKGATASKAALQGERAYRRMPDPDTIMKAYRKVGTVSGLAEKFDVPRHTVNHWARRLRDQGYDIGRSS